MILSALSMRPTATLTPLRLPRLRTLRQMICSALFAVVLASSRGASAQTDDATRAAARALGYEGINEYQAGKYATAAEKLDRAYRALKAPSLGLWSARAFEKAGRLLAASERLIEVTRLDPKSGDVEVQKKAQADAQTELSALERRIPNLVIEVTGPGADGASVTVNGSVVPAALIGVKRPVDPGSVTINAETDGARASSTVVVAEGETKRVRLALRGGGATVPASKSAPAAPLTGSGEPVPAAVTDENSDGGRRTLGWIVLGAGAAGLAAGGVTGILAMTGRSSIEGCEGTACPPSERDEVKSYNRMRTISTIGFIAGGVLAAGGLTLVLTAPNETASARAPTVAYRLSPLLLERGGGLFLSVER
jgi:hypothetical protein